MTHTAYGRKVFLATFVAGGLGLLLHVPEARACGCFTPPDPSVPVVQAGERIAFAMENGQVTAHIQIQYAGNAAEFGWLLPLPSIPVMELGTDELFNQLIAQTQPRYRLVRKYEGNCGFGGGRGGPPSGNKTAGGSGGSGGAEGDKSGSPLVIQDSIGPYDYAVLKADSKEPMLKWLEDNRYFVPAGTDETVGAYIREGAFFLALKLKSGKSAGDLQPVVLKYASDLPMIPIILTSVAAQPNMGIQVWMLGQGRAIPRNYYHTIINDLMIDWWNAGANYNDVIIKAVGEAPGKHSYVTEYAGTSAIMQKILNAPGRFGAPALLAAQPDAYAFVETMWRTGFPISGQVTTILGAYIPYPQGLAKIGIQPAAFYSNLRYWVETYRKMNPSAFEGWPGITYKPDEMTKDLFERVVKPTLDAGELFDKNRYLTRLYTTLSPEDMNLDPVFSFNPELPDVNFVHEATLTYYCGFSRKDDPNATPARLVTEQGWSVDYPYGTGVQTPRPPDGQPYSRQIQILREKGKPEIVVDNPPASGGCGCKVGGAGAAGARDLGGMGGLALLLGATLVARRRRERTAR